MKIYTRTGDGGETGLFGGARVSKASTRVAAYGAVDELNATLGVAVSEIESMHLEPKDERLMVVRDLLSTVQSSLFEIGAELAMAPGTAAALTTKVVGKEQIEAVERAIDRLEESLAPLRNFVLPGGSRAAATLHLARAICRRAERDCVALGADEPLRPELVAYINRLSDLLFVMARVTNAAIGIDEVPWRGRGGE